MTTCDPPGLRRPDLGRPVRADRRHNDAAILTAAARVLATDPAASIRDIADAAGVARPTVYRSFPTRGSLEIVLRNEVGRAKQAALDAMGDWSDGPETLRRFVLAIAEVGQRFPLAIAGHRIGPEPDPVDAHIITFLAWGQQAGALRSDLPAAALNAMLFGTFSSVCGLMPGAPADVVGRLVADLVLDGSRQR